LYVGFGNFSSIADGGTNTGGGGGSHGFIRFSQSRKRENLLQPIAVITEDAGFAIMS
jgi:hypothetical protein